MRSIVTFLRLIRLPNIFTAISNVWAGSFIVAGGQPRLTNMLFASAATAAIYGGGIALNDLCDLRNDMINRPLRVLPSGAMTTFQVLVIVIILLGSGIAAGFTVSIMTGCVAAAMVLCVILYDLILKHLLVAGVLAMATCRGLNWIFGLTTAGKISTDFLIFPVIIFIYTAILTVVSNAENRFPSARNIVKAGIIAFPIIDGCLTVACGYVWQGAVVATLVIPTIILSNIFEME